MRQREVHAVTRPPFIHSNMLTNKKSSRLLYTAMEITLLYTAVAVYSAVYSTAVTIREDGLALLDHHSSSRLINWKTISCYENNGWISFTHKLRLHNLIISSCERGTENENACKIDQLHSRLTERSSNYMVPRLWTRLCYSIYQVCQNLSVHFPGWSSWINFPLLPHFYTAYWPCHCSTLSRFHACFLPWIKRLSYVFSNYITSKKAWKGKKNLNKGIIRVRDCLSHWDFSAW